MLNSFYAQMQFYSNRYRLSWQDIVILNRLWVRFVCTPKLVRFYPKSSKFRDKSINSTNHWSCTSSALLQSLAFKQKYIRWFCILVLRKNYSMNIISRYKFFLISLLVTYLILYTFCTFVTKKHYITLRLISNFITWFANDVFQKEL